MRASPALFFTLALAGCGHRYGADCDTGEDCRSGLCAYVTDPVCMGLKACTVACIEDADCEGPLRRAGFSADVARCLPGGTCAVPGVRDVVCY